MTFGSRMLEAVAGQAKQWMRNSGCDGHDVGHVMRVHRLCRKLMAVSVSPVDGDVLEAAALLHDIGRGDELKDPSVDHAERSAELGRTILETVGWEEEKVPHILACIRSHRYSCGPDPATLEARLLQDADRIDACGAVGVAMTFAFSGATGGLLYDVEDPFAEDRATDGRRYALDHFREKILKLPETLHTQEGRKIARGRREFLEAYLERFRAELDGLA